MREQSGGCESVDHPKFACTAEGTALPFWFRLVRVRVRSGINAPDSERAGPIGIGSIPQVLMVAHGQRRPGWEDRNLHHRVSQRPPAAPRWKQICPAEGVLVRSRRLFPWQPFDRSNSAQTMGPQVRIGAVNFLSAIKGMKRDDGDNLSCVWHLRSSGPRRSRLAENPLHHASSLSFRSKKNETDRTEATRQPIWRQTPADFEANSECTSDRFATLADMPGASGCRAKGLVRQGLHGSKKRNTPSRGTR